MGKLSSNQYFGLLILESYYFINLVEPPCWALGSFNGWNLWQRTVIFPLPQYGDCQFAIRKGTCPIYDRQKYFLGLKVKLSMFNNTEFHTMRESESKIFRDIGISHVVYVYKRNKIVKLQGSDTNNTFHWDCDSDMVVLFLHLWLLDWESRSWFRCEQNKKLGENIQWVDLKAFLPPFLMSSITVLLFV